MNGVGGRERVLMVLDDAVAAARLLDTSFALAQLMQRELQLVYVESAAALDAAALPTAQVLLGAAQSWSPLAPQDVERAWRAQAARLRTLAERASAPRAVRWSLRVTRGALVQTADALRGESDLLLVACAPSRFDDRPRAGRPLIAVVDDGGAAGQQAIQLAQRLAHALGARLESWPAAGAPATVAGRPADLLVCPAAALAAPGLRDLRLPLLLVGTPR